MYTRCGGLEDDDVANHDQKAHNRRTLKAEETTRKSRTLCQKWVVSWKRHSEAEAMILDAR